MFAQQKSAVLDSLSLAHSQGVSTLMKNDPIANGSINFLGIQIFLPILAAIFTTVQNGSIIDGISAFFTWLLWAFFISIVCLIFAAIPLYYVLKKLKLFVWPVVAIFGALVGAFAGVKLLPYGNTVIVALVFSVVGTYSSVAFWYGARQPEC